MKIKKIINSLLLCMVLLKVNVFAYPFEKGPVDLTGLQVPGNAPIGSRLATKTTNSQQKLSVYNVNWTLEARLRWRRDSGKEGNCTEYRVAHVTTLKTGGNWSAAADSSYSSANDKNKNYYIQFKTTDGNSDNLSGKWYLDI